ncbi:MAG: alkaline phosphatase [Sedimentisphaerales bacterium]|nr:alkaline phosphatase [Sedimentisphaerales bacterium]
MNRSKTPFGFHPCKRLLGLILVIGFVSCPFAAAEVKNVILMIGDGMGFQQIKAASLYAYGKEGKLSFEPYYRAEMTTHSANSYRSSSHATDSAASATAMATGQKVDNGVVSQRDDKPLKTILEIFQEHNRAVGLVTTVPISHATPACFGAHESSRNHYTQIAHDYLTETRPNVLFGAYYADGRGLTAEKACQAEYVVLRSRRELQHLLETAKEPPVQDRSIAGLFAPEGMPWEYDYHNPHTKLFEPDDSSKEDAVSYDTAPHLSEMTAAALELLQTDPDGFFLMVEGGKIDWAGHNNLIEHNIFETLEFARAFQTAHNWARDRKDTLIVVTADHECGGLWVVKSRGKGFFPQVFWSTSGHTGANVPLYAVGEEAKQFRGVIDNTQIFEIIVKLIQP